MATAVGEEDAAAWVNAVLAEAAADGGTVDSRIASVSLKLQTMSADLHADVDADMRALLAAAPRAVGEIEDLQAALQRVQDELAAVDARVARAVRCNLAFQKFTVDSLVIDDECLITSR